MSTTPRTLSVFDSWLIDATGKVVGVMLTDSQVISQIGASFPAQVAKVDFDQNAGVVVTTGELAWNADEETLDLGLADGAVLQIGQEVHYHVENKTGVTIGNGTLVQYAGTVGNSGKLLVEPWDGTQPGMTLLGIATSTIVNDDSGYITHFGKVRGIQTNGANYGETWVNGDVLYAGAAGGLTKVQPDAPNTKASVAVVVSSHASNGELFVRPTLGSNLGDDELVEFGTLANRDGIQYNATAGRFENGPLVLTAPASATPTLNRDIAFELTSDTSLTVKVKGADGVVRSAVLTLT